MENASKALIIAGEVLIGVLILTLASYMIVQFGNFSRNLNRQMSEAEINSFNVNFTNFSGRTNISIQDIASIINYAQKNNADYDVIRGDDFYVDVLIDGSSVVANDINALLEQNKNTEYYSCNVLISNISTVPGNSEEIQAKKVDTNNDIIYNEKTRRVSSINFHTIGSADSDKALYANALLQKYNIVWK